MPGTMPGVLLAPDEREAPEPRASRTTALRIRFEPWPWCLGLPTEQACFCILMSHAVRLVVEDDPTIQVDPFSVRLADCLNLDLVLVLQGKPLRPP